MLNPILGAHGLYSPNFINKKVTAGEATRHNHKYLVDTTTGAFTLPLPLNPVPGVKVRFKDYARTFDVNPCRVGRNGQKIMGFEDDYDINTKDAEREFEFIDAEKGWQVK